MTEPWYKDFASEQIPEYITADNVTVRVIAGNSNGIAGAVTRDITEPLYLDIHLPAGASFSTAVPATHNAFIYVYRGAVNSRRHAGGIATHGHTEQRARGRWHHVVYNAKMHA